MARQPSTTRVRAEVSVRATGRLYVGIAARKSLDVDYNDRVRVSIPRENGETIRREGFIDSSGHFSVGSDVFRQIPDEITQGSTKRTEAIVETAYGTWDDEHDLMDERYDEYSHLDSR